MAGLDCAGLSGVWRNDGAVACGGGGLALPHEGLPMGVDFIYLVAHRPAPGWVDPIAIVGAALFVGYWLLLGVAYVLAVWEGRRKDDDYGNG